MIEELNRNCNSMFETGYFVVFFFILILLFYKVSHRSKTFFILFGIVNEKRIFFDVCYDAI